MLELLNARNELTYSNLRYNKNKKFHTEFHVTQFRFNRCFKRQECAECGNSIPKKKSSLKLWRERGFLCRKCFLQKSKVKA